METSSVMSDINSWLVSNSLTEWILHLTTQSFQSLNNGNNTHKPEQVFIPCNNPENLIDEATANLANRILSMGVLPLIELFGVITNVINCLVFVKQGLNDRINLCLFSLALADISFLLLLFATKSSSFLGLFDEDLEEYWKSGCRQILLGPMLGTLSISNMMTMIISVERCVCVVSPFTAKKFLKTRYMAVLIVAMSVYILAVNSLLNLSFVTARVTDVSSNTSRWVTLQSEFYLAHRTMMDVVNIYLLGLAIPCLSLTVVVVTTSITITRLRTTLAWRQKSVNTQMSAGDRREAAVTTMLTVICFIYVTTITPSVTQDFCRVLVPGYLPSGKYCNTFEVVQTLAHVCEVTNSSVNFIVYFTMGSRFRDTVRQLFATRPHSKPLHNA